MRRSITSWAYTKGPKCGNMRNGARACNIVLGVLGGVETTITRIYGNKGAFRTVESIYQDKKFISILRLWKKGINYVGNPVTC
jgi:hypothetical protein